MERIGTEEQYKQYIVLQLVKDKCSILDSYKKGDNVKASINLKGRLWTNPEGIEKCFNTIECWRIEKLEDLQTENNIEVIQPEVIKQNNTIPETEDDLPF